MTEKKPSTSTAQERRGGQPVDKPGHSRREYPHSSGDRNTRSDEDDWPDYAGGTQRDADQDRTKDDTKRRGGRH